MKYSIILMSTIIIACNSGAEEPQPTEDTVAIEKGRDETTPNSSTSEKAIRAHKQTVFFNQRFREVTVTKTDTGKYEVRGQAQMFEADFGWAVYGNGKEVKSGYGLSDAGAPQWGNFVLTVELEEQVLSSPFTLVLFESSAMDGSRQHQLKIELEK